MPLTRVAFMPGKIVHTNEVLTDIGQGYHVWRSAKQAQQYLQRQIDGTLTLNCVKCSCCFGCFILTRIGVVRPTASVVDKNLQTLEEQLEPEIEYGLHEDEAPAAPATSEQPARAKQAEQSQVQPKRVSFADSPADAPRKQEQTVRPVKVKHAEEELDGAFMPMNFMDIREYVDDNGNPISSEVVDLAQEVKTPLHPSVSQWRCWLVL